MVIKDLSCIIPKNADQLRNINFSPRKEKIPENIYVNYINRREIQYFNNFIILNKEIYDELKQDNKNIINPNYCFQCDNSVALICLVDNIFIYKIEHNVLGVGILPEQSDLGTILQFKIEFLIIMEEFFHYNSDSEIQQLFQAGDLEKYLSINRSIRLSNQNINNKKLEMYQENKKIGFIYLLNDFQYDIYWKRSKQKYERKKKQKEEKENKRYHDYINEPNNINYNCNINKKFNINNKKQFYSKLVNEERNCNVLGESEIETIEKLNKEKEKRKINLKIQVRNIIEGKKIKAKEIDAFNEHYNEVINRKKLKDLIASTILSERFEAKNNYYNKLNELRNKNYKK